MQTLTVELITEATCPNVEAARRVLKKACRNLDLEPQWREWAVDDPARPMHTQGYGSPSILVNGVDVAGVTPDNSACCRIYAGGEGVPAVEQVMDVLRKAQLDVGF